MVIKRRLGVEQAAQRAKAQRVTEETGKGYVSVSATRKRGGVSDTYHDDHKEVAVMSQRFDETNPPAYVRVAAGQTLNLGDYESLRIDCGVTIPCDRKKIDEAYQIASQFVYDRLMEEQTLWLGSGNEKHTKGVR